MRLDYRVDLFMIPDTAKCIISCVKCSTPCEINDSKVFFNNAIAAFY